MIDEPASRVISDRDRMVKTEFHNLDSHFKEWQQIAERLKDQMAPGVFNMVEVTQRLAEPMLEAQKALRSVADQIIAGHSQLSELAKSIAGSQIQFPKFDFPKFDLPDLSYLKTQFEQFRNSFQGFPAFHELQKSFQELPPRTQEAVLLLALHGWYFDLEMTFPQLWQLKRALSDGNVNEAEEALVNYFEGRIDEIEKSVAEVFPSRSHLIRAAFNAHRRHEYELSIPVLLAQADGMCKDAINQYLFLKQNKKPQTALYVEQIVADAFRASLLSPLAQTLPISASERERPDGTNALNRHMVLHGEALDYGSKANSLRAISLINYLTQILGDELSGADHTEVED